MTAAATLGDFIGIPYVPRGRSLAGLDCWGLVLLAARELFGLALPEFFYSEADLLPDAEVLIREQTSGATPQWRPVGRAGLLTPYPPGVVHIFRVAGHPTHCGLHLGGLDFLHTLEGRNACVESIGDANWRHRHLGSYRWAN